jgi:hypothetical protein
MRVNLLLLLAVTELAPSQQNSVPLFRSESNLVPIEVQVVDRNTRQPVAGLTRDDFEVFDEGERKEIVAFDDGSGPRDVALLLDVSGGPINEGVIFAAKALLGLQRPEDRLALLSFSDGAAELRAPLTDDERRIEQALYQVFTRDRRRATKNSRLLDAIRSAEKILADTAVPRRPLIIAVTHNREKNSKTRQEDLIRSLLKRSIRLEALTIPQEWPSSTPYRGRIVGNPSLGFPTVGPPEPPPPAPPTFLDNLHSVEPVAAATGGQTIHLDYANARRAASPDETGRTWNVATIASVIETEILARFREEYGLAIRGASSPEPKFRRLVVKLSPEAERRYPDAVVYARSGYYSSQPDNSTSQENRKQ